MPSQSSDFDSRREESMTPNEIVPESTRTKEDEDHDYFMEQMTADAFVDDDVSLARWAISLVLAWERVPYTNE